MPYEDPRDTKMIKGMRSREELTKDWVHNPKSATFEVLLDLRELLQQQAMRDLQSKLTTHVNTTIHSLSDLPNGDKG